MIKFLVFLMFLFHFILTIDSHHTNNRISVYYESICPDSRRFILNQLIPTYEKLSPYVDIDLIPFGNANVSYPNHDFKPYFQCQHGPDECYGNKAQACVIDLTKSTRPSLSYVKCMFSADNWRQTVMTAQKCAETLSMNWTQIKECIDGSHGDRLLVAHSHRTFNLEPQHRFIPWVIIDGTHTDEIQSRSQTNLMQYMCEAYHNNHLLRI
ncbi:unnamed protein product [Oppiella nova]|uniref:Gamma-interferon-inducible lysosomal thiol reductase n=1 Tax=Oppiella nova TaxID=334625 RepID=A0A7R9LWW5_9ACAR|nr:unnamed protein product [Oppiella nova]CAG2167806.1 unnamed protein product [Oppiella nova]